ncbi:MAG TPA: dephospho-CoA kinase [Firmicutes bacterium]|nr:dephospho-CoA kinase [Bacillota bacterium]
MLVIGLTGGISSGKSTVSQMFINKGVTVLDADRIVRDLQSPGSLLLQEIKVLFGQQLILEDGSLNRQALGALIFNDENAKQKLNDLIHPKVKEELIYQLDRARQQEKKLVVLDVPLLYESGFDELADVCLVVYVDAIIQKTRLMKRDQIDEAYALSKINSQLSLEIKKEKADFVLDNTGDLVELQKRFEVLYTQLMRMT